MGKKRHKCPVSSRVKAPASPAKNLKTDFSNKVVLVALIAVILVSLLSLIIYFQALNRAGGNAAVPDKVPVAGVSVEEVGAQLSTSQVKATQATGVVGLTVINPPETNSIQK